jgi:redox-sensitive bicupin YhaK (pirin superfamily)
MEIVTYILRGAVAHRDSMGNGSTIRPGDVQLMSAGTGVMHSEFNAHDDAETELLQMWVAPAKAGGKPRYEESSFSTDGAHWRLLASPNGTDGSLTIGQNAHLHAFRGQAGDRARLSLDQRGSWLHVGAGEISIKGSSGTTLQLKAGDGAAIRRESWIDVEVPNGASADVVLWQVPD